MKLGGRLPLPLPGSCMPPVTWRRKASSGPFPWGMITGDLWTHDCPQGSFQHPDTKALACCLHRAALSCLRLRTGSWVPTRVSIAITCRLSVHINDRRRRAALLRS